MRGGETTTLPKEGTKRGVITLAIEDECAVKQAAASSPGDQHFLLVLGGLV